MKITMYELLGLVKDGKAPKKIKYNTFELKRTMSNNLLRMYVDEEGMFFPEYYSGLTLNDEVEILEDTIEDRYRELEKVRNYKPKPSYLTPKEEKKIPKKLETYKENNEIFLENFCYKNLPIHKDSLTPNERVIVYKLNEVIDYFKSKGDE